MLDKYEETQKLFYTLITKSFLNNKISHAYLIQTNGVSYSFSLAIDFVKFLLCNGVYNKKICNLIDNGAHENFVLIDDDKKIKKEVILELQRDFSLKTSKTGGRKVYLIKDASLLNDSSANSLLKFLEEPEDDIVAILLANDITDVKETISSRCQIVNLVNNSFDYRDLFNYEGDDNMEQDEFIEKEYESFLNFYDSLEKNGKYVLKNRNVYEFGPKIENLLKFGIYLYFDLINGILKSTNQLFLPESYQKNEILKMNDLSTLLKKVTVINDFLVINRYNVNTNLFLDNFIISLGGE